MRFDYQPPPIQFKSFNQKRLLTAYLVFIGLGCILLALFTKHTNTVPGTRDAKADAKRPVLLSKASGKPILSLNNNVTPVVAVNTQTEKSESVPTTAIIKEKWHTITVEVGDTMGKLFDKLGVSSRILSHIIRNNPEKEELYNIYPGQKLDFLFDDSKELKEIKLNLSNTKTLHVTKTDDGFRYYYDEKQPIKKVSFSSARISGSLYSTAHSVGLDENLIMQMADIFGCDIDFNLDIRENDSFKVLYEENYISDKKINSGKILAVEFNNQGKLYKAVRYTDDKGNSGYYSQEGFNLQKTFLRSPVEFTRISSHFSNARRHPILHKIRSHKGVDYAAPEGTPIKAAADGRISFIGQRGGYGKSIEIIHGHKYSTFYAHLCRFSKKLRHGSNVRQGEIIGYVGKTGLATGAHLHYEFRINGVHHNPVTVSLPRTQSISTKLKKEFSLHASTMLDQLNIHSNSKVAKND